MAANKILGYSSMCLIVFLISSNVFCQVPKNKKKFNDFYTLDKVSKVEVSLFKEGNYNSVDGYEELINFMQCSKLVVAKFIPKTEVVFYDSSNSNTHNICFSKTFRYFKIDGRTFVISKKKSKEISKIIGNAIRFAE